MMELLSPTTNFLFESLQNSRSDEDIIVMAPPNPDSDFGCINIQEVEEGHVSQEHLIAVLEKIFTGFLKAATVRSIAEGFIYQHQLGSRLSYFNAQELDAMLTEMFNHMCDTINIVYARVLAKKAAKKAKAEAKAAKKANKGKLTPEDDEEEEEFELPCGVSGTTSISRIAFYQYFVHLYGWKAKVSKRVILSTFDKLVSASSNSSSESKVNSCQNLLDNNSVNNVSSPPKKFKSGEEGNFSNNHLQMSTPATSSSEARTTSNTPGLAQLSMGNTSPLSDLPAVVSAKTKRPSLLQRMRKKNKGQDENQPDGQKKLSRSDRQKEKDEVLLTQKGMKHVLQELVRGNCSICDLVSCSSVLKLIFNSI
eukprot:CAMPEP_0175147984 /NCGR_PEP_ID=MMETSP0087-20121206/16339_1 /TAXON_ID=136419 /ORGANISM="Unknown Unknown, Strain D1" /LENGTH=365 /DNA_ID=CAMNT_0016433321 /DNA_START=186 /DNA_END=1283 /DNA_ORIENTATION=+